MQRDRELPRRALQRFGGRVFGRSHQQFHRALPVAVVPMQIGQAKDQFSRLPQGRDHPAVRQREGFRERTRLGHGLSRKLGAGGFESGAQIDLVGDEEVRRRPAILEGRNKPEGNVSRRRELEARPIQEFASLTAFLAGHFSALPSLTAASQAPADEGVELGGLYALARETWHVR